MPEPEGTAALEQPAGHVILIVAKGHVGATVGRRVARELAEALRGTPKVVFFDLATMTEYHSDLRIHCTQAILSNKPNVKGVTVIARAKIVKMGVAVANVALGGLITTIDSRAGFDAALRASLRAG